jgi:hypothetical protein
MKALAGVMGALIGLLLVGVGGYFALVRKPPPPKQTVSQTGPDKSLSDPSATPHPDKPVNAPVSREEQLKDELGEKRLPFFRFLRQNYGNIIERSSVLDDYDTLDLVVTKQDDATLQGVIQQAIAPSAKQYGFRRVRFYTRNAPNAIEPFTVIAESSEDGSGRWNTFRK